MQRPYEAELDYNNIGHRRRTTMAFVIVFSPVVTETYGARSTPLEGPPVAIGLDRLEAIPGASGIESGWVMLPTELLALQELPTQPVGPSTFEPRQSPALVGVRGFVVSARSFAAFSPV